MIGIAILVAVVVWLLMNVVLPLALLNSALIFTILALTIKDHKPVFASLTFVGAGYMLLDISNGWLSANFVNNVVKTPDWLTAFVYLNAAAVGVSAWILVQPLFQKAAETGASNRRNRVLLWIAAGALVGVPVVILPVVHYIVGSPFSNRTAAAPMSSVVPAATPRMPPVSTSVTPTRTQQRKNATKTLKGTISRFECGDNCYLIITDRRGKDHTALCLAPLCNAWTALQTMPAEFQGKKVRVTMGQGKQYDGAGNVMGTHDAFTDIQLVE